MPRHPNTPLISGALQGLRDIKAQRVWLSGSPIQVIPGLEKTKSHSLVGGAGLLQQVLLWNAYYLQNYAGLAWCRICHDKWMRFARTAWQGHWHGPSSLHLQGTNTEWQDSLCTCLGGGTRPIYHSLYMHRAGHPVQLAVETGSLWTLGSQVIELSQEKLIKPKYIWIANSTPALTCLHFTLGW